MNKKKSLIIASILLGIGLIFGVMAYFMFHYLGTNGKLGSTFYNAAQKPLVTYVSAGFSTLCFFGALVFLLVALIGFSKNKRLNYEVLE